MPRKSAPDANQPSLFNIEDYLKTALCVPLLRQKVDDWRNNDYRGATDITRQLLTYWFKTDHQLADGRRFAYHASQQTAIETQIYCYEVAKARTRNALLEKFAQNNGGEMRVFPNDTFARYCTKMATGSGKTKVMSLAIVWHYWNAIMGSGEQEYAKTFLLVAPNVIVLERLKTDFQNGSIFRFDPVMPDHLRYIGWDLECVMRGDGERADSEGMLFLTNIQQLYEKTDRTSNDEPEAMVAVLGPKPKADLNATPDFATRIAARGGPLLVINDEAHHTHDEGSEWNNVIKNLHTLAPIASQLDFSATPRYQKGALFEWIISDYPLKQAILDGIVKRPYKGVADISEVSSDDASTKYEGFLTAGVHRWREYRDLLAPMGKRPLLFIMLNSTAEAEDVGDYLRAKYPGELDGKRTLVIHTDKEGEITKKALDEARTLAREVDEPDCPVNAIVSVLMLREGWDVQNVTVVVGLRPYSAKANILPEQTIGRGLRLMFRGQGSGYTERVDIIGNKAFLAFVADLERYEQVNVEEFELGKDTLHILNITPMAEKRQYDIALPVLSPVLQRKKTLADEIRSLDVTTFQCPRLPRREGDQTDQTFHYEGKDIITMQTEFERDYIIPPIKTSGEIVAFYARAIAKDLKLPSQFSVLAPKVGEFFRVKAFGATVDLEDETIIRAMSRSQIGYVVRDVFAKALRPLLVETLSPELVSEARHLADCSPFPFTNPCAVAGHHCILNYAPCSNQFEETFGKWLDDASDIAAWCKIPDKFGFAIEYTDPSASLRLYYPDFVAVTTDGKHWLLETKGAETVEVAAKSAAAELWCENATTLTDTTWGYRIVPQKSFQQMQPHDFADLLFL